MKLRLIVRAFRSESGTVAIIAGVTLTAMLAFAAVTVDVGMLYTQKRALQSATDAAAMAATQDLNTASNTASTFMQRNGFSADQVNSVVATGVYCPDSTIASSARFTQMAILPTSNTSVQCANVPDVTTTNAVRVTNTMQAPLYFGRLFVPGPKQSLTASATATRIDLAGLRAGTGVLEANTANTILSALTGGNINLTLVQYQGLASVNVQALDFLNALAINLNATAGTYGSLLGPSTVDVGKVLQSEIDVLDKAGDVANVNALGIILAGITGNPQINLGNLFDLGIWQSQPIQSATAPSALQANLNVYQLTTLALQSTLQVANGKNAVSLTGLASSSPVFSISTAATIIEPPQSPPFAFGPVGVSVHTSQVRLVFDFKLLNVPGLPSIIDVPIYIEVGDGDAQITDISCPADASQSDQRQTEAVTISAKSAVANVYLGTAPGNLMTNFSQPVPVSQIQPANLVNLNVLGLGIISVTARAQVSVGSLDAQSHRFSYDDIQQNKVWTVASTNMVQNLLATLGSTTSLGVAVPVLPILNGLLSSTLNGLLNTLIGTPNTPGPLQVLLNSLDGIVDPLLAALGIKLGYMDVYATGVRCGVPALVQ